jgi:integrase
LTIFVKQRVHHGRVEQRLKTTNGFRQVDLDPAIADLLKEFVGDQKSGFLFHTTAGKPVSPSNIIRRHLHPALKKPEVRQPAHGDP